MRGIFYSASPMRSKPTRRPVVNHPGIQAGLQLDGDPQHISNYYRGWSGDYDEEVAQADYTAPEVLCELLCSLSGEPGIAAALADRSLAIHDAGCGTGLLGAALAAAGFGNLEGSDLTGEMVEIARRRGVYRNLWSGVDLTLEPRPAWRRHYDAVLCCGVFTCGHVPPETLLNLAGMTRPGGVVLLSTRIAYYEDSRFQAFSDACIKKGALTLLATRRDAPYTEDSAAHYWAYRVA